MLYVDAMGDACPLPVVKTKEAIKKLNGAGSVTVYVDNEIAVQNLQKMARQKNYGAQSEKMSEHQYAVVVTVGDTELEEPEKAALPRQLSGGRLVVISADTMGSGDDVLGKALMKGFIFALTQQEELPEAMLFYNGGAKLTCAGSPAVEDIKLLAGQGVEVLTCGTCLNHYGLTEKLQVGEVTNMYAIAEKMLAAGVIIKP